MKRIALAAIVASIACTAHADSVSDYIQFEAGLGVAHARDMGDGTWIQQGARSNHEHLNTPAFMAGFTGPLYTNGDFDVRWHLNYVYTGTQSASVDGVPDAQYDPKQHRIVGYQGERFSPFNGQGHVQGVPLTLDAGYTYRGFRFCVEAGAWVYWNTWHESLYNLGDEWQDLSHKTKPQIGYVVGASVARGNMSMSYRYMQVKPQWNPYPGIVSGVQTLMFTYRY